MRVIDETSETGEILQETSYLHNKRNGLQIEYHTNGFIKEINYYLDGKLWEVISRADSTGKLLDPGTLRDGNGVKRFHDFYGMDPNCFETYKNGLPEGPFYKVIDAGTAAKGELTYNMAAVNYLPAKKVLYTDAKGDTSTDVFEKREYNFLFSDSSGLGLKVIRATDDSVVQPAQVFPYLELGFGDPAIVPRGHWEITTLESKKLIETVDYDNCGNAINVIVYKSDGTVFSQKKYPPCNKRKFIKKNPDGSFYGELCMDTLKDLY
jgi:antitoxin component YwqK of YwqJK toxin-antitoxin module